MIFNMSKIKGRCGERLTCFPQKELVFRSFLSEETWPFLAIDTIDVCPGTFFQDDLSRRLIQLCPIVPNAGKLYQIIPGIDDMGSRPCAVEAVYSRSSLAEQSTPVALPGSKRYWWLPHPTRKPCSRAYLWGTTVNLECLIRCRPAHILIFCIL